MRSILFFCVFILGLAEASAFNFWGVSLTSVIKQLNLSRDASQAGALLFEMNGSCFEDASAETPIYVRITFGSRFATAPSSTLAEELVYGAAHPDTAISQAINLPLFMKQGTTTTVTAPVDAVQIVRWRAGENQLWLRVNASSDTWVDNGPPNDALRVHFAIGLAAYDAWQTFDHLGMAQLSNLPGYVRDQGEGSYSQSDVISLLFGVRTDQSQLVASPNQNEKGTLLVVNLKTYDHTTSGVESAGSTDGIVLGQIVSPVYPIDTVLGIATDPDPVSESVVLTAANSNAQNCPVDSVNYAAASFGFNLDVVQDFGGQTTQAVMLTVMPKLDNGEADALHFRVATDSQNNPLPGPLEDTYLLEADALTSDAGSVWQAYTPIGNAVELGGVAGWVSDRAVLWLETDANGELNRDFTLSAAPLIAFTGNVLLDYDVRVFSRGIEAFTDEAPFDRTFVQRQHFVSFSDFAEQDVQLGTLEACSFTVSDGNLIAYMYDNLDSDQDGQISDAELAAVEVLNLEGLGINSLAGLTSFPNLRQVFAADNFISDFTGIQAWLDSATGQAIILDLRYNTIQDGTEICTVLGQIESSIANLGGTLHINPQGDDRGYGLSLERWSSADGSSVLDLVAAINAGGGPDQSYTICND